MPTPVSLTDPSQVVAVLAGDLNLTVPTVNCRLTARTASISPTRPAVVLVPRVSCYTEHNILYYFLLLSTDYIMSWPVPLKLFGDGLPTLGRLSTVRPA